MGVKLKILSNNIPKVQVLNKPKQITLKQMTSFAPLQFLEFLVSYSILTQIGGGRVFTICQREPLKPLFAGFGSFGQFCCIWKPTLFALATYSSGISIRSETPERKIFSNSFEPLQSFLAALSGNKTEERSGGRFRVVKQALLLLLDYCHQYYYYYLLLLLPL